MKDKSSIIFILIIVIVSGITIYRVTNTKNDITTTAEQNKMEQRLNSLAKAKESEGLDFPIDTIKSIIPYHKETITTEITQKEIIILLSDAGCNPCQIRELKMLDTLMNNYNINTKAIYIGANVNEAAKLRKVSRTEIPFYYTNDIAFSDFYSNNHFPVIFLVEDQKIISNFIPITNDDVFSAWYYKILVKKI